MQSVIRVLDALAYTQGIVFGIRWEIRIFATESENFDFIFLL